MKYCGYMLYSKLVVVKALEQGMGAVKYQEVGSVIGSSISSNSILNVSFGFLRRAIADFIANESVQNAKTVYEFFLSMYRPKDPKGNPLADMIDIMRSYEVNASVLTEKQRDHYIHSVNVFLLGLYIYESNDSVRKAFESVNGKGTFDTPEESFLFTWGNAALFHDVGYPVEIATNQLKAFMRSVADADGGSSKAKVRIDVVPRDDIFEVLLGSNRGGHRTVRVDDLLASNIESKIGKDPELLDSIVHGYFDEMMDKLFIDHGFFSAVILLKSYSANVQAVRMSRDRFDTEVVDAASAILLHNLYPHTLSKMEAFGKLSIGDHPTGYLLILCDSLQEWNREGYGYKSRDSVRPKASGIVSSDGMLRINYRTIDCNLCKDFGFEKEEEVRGCLDIDGPFPSGFFITSSCDNRTDVFLKRIEEDSFQVHPRPLLENIIDIAKGIHEDYNSQRLKDKPGVPLEYPTWESLTQDLQYSNIRQALCIVDKLDAVGFRISNGPDGDVTGFTDEEVEVMSVIEHDRWCDERISNGWVYGPKKDVDNRISPYIVPWEELSDEIREYDRQAVRNIIPILKRVGLSVERVR